MFWVSIETFGEKIKPVVIDKIEDGDKSLLSAFFGTFGLSKFWPTEQKKWFLNKRLLYKFWVLNKDHNGKNPNIKNREQSCLSLWMNQKV